MERKLNKPIAGFHLLMILTNADGVFAKEEGDVIVEYLTETFPFRVEIDEEVDFLFTLDRSKYNEHFRKAMNDFYEDSTQKERDHFLAFAVKLVKADNVIDEEENSFLKELFDAWAPEYEEEI
ncbi:MAG: TerB family tellurite resistance protein [Bacteroidia bacterium]